ncbi:MAG: hypothetical protein J0L84_02610 [Verrucomicrobia bacterium]|nr:hypothetical protein [Verrucomicrobiota bacterium]
MAAEIRRVWHGRFPKRAIGIALGVLLIGGGWVAFRSFAPRNPHLESLISEDLGIGCNDDTVRRGELAAAGDEALPFLMARIRARPDWVERGLQWGPMAEFQSLLGSWGWEPLARSLSSRAVRTQNARRQALFSLVLMGPDAATARGELEQLGASSAPLRWKVLAAVTAGAPGDPAILSNYLAHLTLEAFRAPNAKPVGLSLESVQTELIREFPRIWPTHPAPLEGLLPLLESGDAHVRLAAARALIPYGTAASNAAPRLVQLLSDPDRRIHPSAAHALGVVSPGEHGALAVTMMLAQQRTNNSWTGDYAHQLYGALGPLAREAVPSLTETLRERPRRHATGPVAFALWRIQREASPEIVEELARGLDTPIQRFQRMSLMALKEIGPPASDAVPALRRMLSSRFATLQQEAREALQAIQGGP